MKWSPRVGIRNTVILAVGLVASAQSLNAQWVRWPLTQGGNGHWYQVFRTATPISWVTAFTNAQKHGYLVTITSPEENAFVFSLVNSDSAHYWNRDFGPLLGGFQPDGSLEPAGGWTWVTGEQWTYTNWANGQPDEGNPGEAGLHFWVGPTWNDVPTNIALFVSYIVERDTPPPFLLDIRFSEVELSWQALTNVHYRAEYRSDLTTNVWMPLNTNVIIGTGERHTLYERITAGDGQRFYRIVQVSGEPPP